MTKGRDDYIDGIRGIAITAVVLIHVASVGLGERKLYDWNLQFTLLTQQLLLFAVPTFFFLAGLFAGRSQRFRTDPFGETIARLRRILVPYLIWSTLVFVFLGDHSQFVKFGVDLLFGRVVSPYYFIAALACLTLITPTLLRFSRRPWLVPAAVAIGLLHLLGAYLARWHNPSLNWWFVMAPPTGWLPFYCYGIERSAELNSSAPSDYGVRFAAFAICALALQIVEAETLTWSIGVNGGGLGPIKLSSYLYAWAVIELMMAYRGRAAFPSWLVMLGLYSFGIFWIHQPIRWGLMRLIPETSWVFDVQPLYQIALTVSTIAICVALISLSRYLLRDRSSRILGL